MKDFNSNYTNSIAKLVSLRKRPTLLQEKKDGQLAVLDLFYQSILSNKDRLCQFSSLCNELLDTFQTGCTYLSIFRLEKTLKVIDELEKIEKQIIEQIDIIEDSSIVTSECINKVKSQTRCWRTGISSQTSADYIEFMQSLLKDLQKRVYEMGREARLERDLAQTREENKRMLDQDKRKLEDILEEELDKEEKRRRAIELYNQQFKRRNKK